MNLKRLKEIPSKLKGLGPKLKAWWPEARARFKESTSKVSALWNRRENGALVRALIVFCFVLIFTMFYTTYRFFKPAPTHEIAEAHSDDEAHEEHGKEEHGKEEHGDGAANEVSILNRNPIPKSILARRDGKMEPGHDLVDPDVKAMRSLSSALNENYHVEKPYRFVDLPDIIAGTRAGSSLSGKVLATAVLEVDSGATENEVRNRQVEFASIISSLISERQRDSLKTPEGKAALKQDIQREINHQLKAGQVTDVLFTHYFVM